ncbi:MAG: MlaD family protein [Paracraurococcus sp.]|jgi:ABC-type transporter Mla subunit MlaD
MAQSNTLYLRVGALVLAGLALGIGFVLFLTADRLGSNNQQFETYIRESVQGLEVGAAVRYRGVSIGRVSEIGLVAAEYRRPSNDPIGAAFQLVYVRFAIDNNRIGETPDIEEAIRLGLRVRMASQGITGVSYLELDFVDPQRFPPRAVPWQPRFPYIPAIPSTVAQVQNAAEQLLQKLQEVNLPSLLDNVIGLAADMRHQVQDGDLATTLREASGLLRDLHTAVNQADVPAIAGEVRGAAADARQLLGGREVKQALTNLSTATAELRAASQRLPGSVTNLDATMRTARSVTTDIQAELAPILRDLRAAVANLRDTTEQLRRNPSQAIFGAPPPAPSGSRR